MSHINIRKFIYTFRHKYVTFNNMVFVVAFLIAAGWAWGSLQAMQRNYSLQKEVDYKQRQLELTQLQHDSLALQKNYYQSDEYKELALRDSLGLVMPGEKLLILPPNSDAAKKTDADATNTNTTVQPVTNQATTSNIVQWVNFLFGGYSKSIETK